MDNRIAVGEDYLRAAFSKTVRQIICGKISIRGHYVCGGKHTWSHPVTMRVNDLFGAPICSGVRMTWRSIRGRSSMASENAVTSAKRTMATAGLSNSKREVYAWGHISRAVMIMHRSNIREGTWNGAKNQGRERWMAIGLRLRSNLTNKVYSIRPNKTGCHNIHIQNRD